MSEIDQSSIEKCALQNFVEWLVSDFDYALDTLDYYNGGNPVLTKRWLQLSKAIPSDQDRRKKYAQMVVESILHSILYRLGSTSDIRIMVKGEDGNFYGFR